MQTPRFLGLASAFLLSTSLFAQQPGKLPDPKQITPPTIIPPAPVLTDMPVTIFDTPTACGPFGRIWVNTEYLVWWTRGQSLPALLTTGPTAASSGALGDPTTRVIYGNQSVDNNARSGARFTLGGWLNAEQTWGLESSFFLLERVASTATAYSPGNPLLVRPFVDVNPGGAAQVLDVARGTTVSGLVSFNTATTFFGGDVNVRRNVFCSGAGRVDLIAGYRYLGLSDRLNVLDVEVAGATPPAGLNTGDYFVLHDNFNTRNRFHGGQLGIMTEFWRGRTFFQINGKAAIGNNSRTITISGDTQLVQGGIANPPANGGFAAQSTNIGTFHDNAFSFASELNFNIGYAITPRMRVMAGYTFLYWSNVVRAANQYDLNVNTSQLVGPLVGQARPGVLFNSTDFWAQGMNFGLEFRF